MTIQSLEVDVAALQRLPETDPVGLRYDEKGLGPKCGNCIAVTNLIVVGQTKCNVIATKVGY